MEVLRTVPSEVVRVEARDNDEHALCSDSGPSNFKKNLHNNKKGSIGRIELKFIPTSTPILTRDLSAYNSGRVSNCLQVRHPGETCFRAEPIK